jgi:Tfp pilus assembly protein PilF
VNPEKFHPQAAPATLATQKRFKFLFVGGTIFRKGPDVLLQAYLANFTAADDVCLVIKDFGGRSVYAGQTFEAKIRAVQAQPGAPEILYINEELPPDALPGLYTACDCLVLPYRGEGFGLPVLEAMACGRPVMVTRGGATDDFVRDDFAWRIPAQRQVFGGEISGMKLAGAGWLLEPEAGALGRFLREAAANPTETRRRGGLAAQHARHYFTWAQAGALAAQRLQTLGRVIRDAATVSAPKAAPAAPVKITLPPAALIGHLAEARELVRQKKTRAAWEAVLAALAKRPFHPEAYLLLAEIALSVGAGRPARLCAEHARHLAPNWKPAKKLLNQRFNGTAQPEWLKLPEALQTPEAGRRPRLSVCLIVKNEEKFLGRCLDSVRGLASQIVVVDTGSTDRTAAIAREHGAEAHEFAWTDDFSAARNAALEHATGDWVLMLDADEELSAEGREKLPRAMTDPAVMAWRLPLVDVGREANGFTYVPRMFRNAPALFYVGRVHEQVFSSVEVRCAEWGLANRIGDATLIHHGYTEAMMRDRNKVERNLRLLERAVEELPGEPHLLMHLGLELTRSGRAAEGLERDLEAFEILSAKPAREVVPELRETLLMQAAAHMTAAKRFDEVARVLTSPLAELGGGLTASLHFSLGLAQFELRRFREAADQMRQCLAKRQQPTCTSVNAEIKTAAPHLCLALCLDRAGDPAGAEAAYQAGLAETGLDGSLRREYARWLAGQNRPVEALQQLHQLVTQHDQDLAAWQLGGQIALSRPQFLKFARDWTGEALRRRPEDPLLLAQRAEVLLLSEDLAGALPLWEQLWEQTAQPGALAALILCETVEALTTHAPEEGAEEAAVSRAFIQWYRKLLAVKGQKTMVRLNGQTEKLGRALPTAARMLEAAMGEARAAA